MYTRKKELSLEHPNSGYNETFSSLGTKSTWGNLEGQDFVIHEVSWVVVFFWKVSYVAVLC